MTVFLIIFCIVAAIALAAIITPGFKKEEE
jgi:hypothetical protein